MAVIHEQPLTMSIYSVNVIQIRKVELLKPSDPGANGTDWRMTITVDAGASNWSDWYLSIRKPGNSYIATSWDVGTWVAQAFAGFPTSGSGMFSGKTTTFDFPISSPNGYSLLPLNSSEIELELHGYSNDSMVGKFSSPKVHVTNLQSFYDTIAPTISGPTYPASEVNEVGGQTYVKGSTVTVTYTASDTGGSGLAGISIDGGSLQPSPASKTYTVTANFTSQAYSRDNSGNQSGTISKAFKYDNTPPTGTIDLSPSQTPDSIFEGGVYYIKSKEAKFKLTHSDAGSGLF